LISSGPNFFISPKLITISEVLAVILSRPINFALDKLFFGKIFFLFLITALLVVLLLKSSTSSKLGFNSFKLIRGELETLSSARDIRL